MSDVVLFPPDAPRATRPCNVAIMPGKAVQIAGNDGWNLGSDAADSPLAIMGPDNHFGKGIDSAIPAGSQGEAGYLGQGEVGYVFVKNAGALAAGTSLCHAANGDLDAGSANNAIVAVLDEDHEAGADAVLRRVRGANGFKDA